MVCVSTRTLTFRSYVQSNILVTQDGNVCLGDFGITGACGDFWFHGFRFKLGTARYMAPERFGYDYGAGPASEASDVYSLAMTSLTVCSSSVGRQ